MNNNTRDDYKKAIRAKYEIEKEGDLSNFFEPTSPANLRNLCWERFISFNREDDLNIFSSVFGFEFDIEKSKYFSTKTTDKFRPIMSFLKGEKEPAKFNRVELTAILVDFHPRPFKKFKEKGFVQIENTEGSVESITSPYLPQMFFTKELNLNDDSIEIEQENAVVKEVEVKQEEIKLEEIKLEETKGEEINEEVVNEAAIDSGVQKVNNFLGSKPVNHIGHNQQGVLSLQQTEIVPKPIPKKLKYALIFAALIFVTGIIYFTLPQKDCMQWSEDHYERVDCDSKVQGFAALNPVELLDESLINLKKVTVCDTTQYFDKNGNAVIWYAKTANGIDFFDGHGRHPENNNSLRPVTQYIINKYVKKQ